MVRDSNILKLPMEEKDLQKLLNVKSVPTPLKDNVIYEGDNLDEFFIGYRKTSMGNKESYKVTTKSVVLKNKGVNLPVKRNDRLEMPWKIDSCDNLPEKIVIVLEEEEEYFILDNKSSTKCLIIGVFDREEIINYVEAEVGCVC